MVNEVDAKQRAAINEIDAKFERRASEHDSAARELTCSLVDYESKHKRSGDDARWREPCRQPAGK